MTPNPKRKYGWVSIIYDLAGDITKIDQIENMPCGQALNYINYINDVRISEKSLSK
jgi:hypothetical protein